MKILNLTQHSATPAQIEAGVIDLKGIERRYLIELLTFDELPSANKIWRKARGIAWIAVNLQPSEDRDFAKDAGFITHAMISGEPFLMGPLEQCLRHNSIVPVYYFNNEFLNGATKNEY